MKTKALCIMVISILLLSSISIYSVSSQELMGSLDYEEQCYGFIVEVNENQSYEMQTNISILINKLLNENITVYWLCENISISTNRLFENYTYTIFFKKGCFIIPFTQNQYHDSSATVILYHYNLSKDIEIYKIKQELTDIKIHILVEPKIAYIERLTIEPFNYFNCLKKAGFQNNEILTCNKINDGELTNNKFNVVVHGGQQAYYLDLFGDMLNPFTRLSYMSVKKFVRNGGGYVGSCNGAYTASAGLRRPIKLPYDLQYAKITGLLNLQIGIIDRDVYRALPGASGPSTIMWGKASSGISMRIIKPDSPVSFGLPQIIKNLTYIAGPMFLEKKIGKSNTDDIAVIEDIGDEEDHCWDAMMNMCPIYNNKLVPDSVTQKRLHDWVNYSIGKSIWVTSKYGDGKVVAFGGHPEYISTESPPRIVYNAIFYACSKGPFNVDVENKKTIIFDNFSSNGPYSNYPSEEILFYGNNSDIDPSDSWSWSFGDNTFANNQTVSRGYNDYGIYDLILVMCNENNQLFLNKSKVLILGDMQINPIHYNAEIDTPITFNAELSGGFEPFSYTWDFGDGGTSIEKNPFYNYSEEGVYNCKLTVEDLFGNILYHNFSTVVNDNNILNISIETDVEDKANINEEIIFDIKTPGDKSYDITLLFDDGFSYEYSINNKISTKITHSYNDAGTYYPVLIVENSSGEIFVIDTKIVINNAPGIPEIDILFSDLTVCQRCLFAFSAKDKDKDLLWYEFEFDGEEYGNSTKRFKYNSDETGIMYAVAYKEGEHKVRAKAIDPYNAESEWSETLIINISKGNLFKRPVYGLHRFFAKNPGKFQKLHDILFTF